MMASQQTPSGLIRALALIVISLFTVSLQAQPAAEKPQETKGDPYTLSTCPVSGKILGSAGDPVVFDYEGREVRFCCPACVDKFKANPKGFLEKTDAAIIKEQLPFYPLATCVVSGEKLGGDMGIPLDYVYNNRLVRFCCPSCLKDFQKDPQKYLQKLDKAVIDKQEAAYPLKTCVVSGEALGGAMGDPVEIVVGNRLVKLCCNGCVKKVKADPAKYIALLDKAAGMPGQDPKATSDDKSADTSMATCPMGTCTKPAGS